MRAFFLAATLTLFAADALAQSAPDAQAAYGERRALLEADRRCHLFDADMRGALTATAAQARGALLRGGWTLLRLDQLEDAAVTAANARACGDPRTAAAADRARRGFAGWRQIRTMDFPGAERLWAARRSPDPVDHWILRQTLTAPRPAVFGVREFSGAHEVTLILPLGRGPAPGAVQMAVRDVARAPRSQMDVPARIARGLQAGAPSPGTARVFLPAARRVETVNGERRALYAFTPDAIAAIAALDPREAVEIELGDGRRPLLIEVGDFAAARAFLALR